MKRGLSLLEVLISMFVLTIGLLSVASLVPVGQSEMLKGGIADRTSAMGQSAYHDIRVRGLLDTRDANGNPLYAEADGTPITTMPTKEDPTGSGIYRLDLVTGRLYLDANNVVSIATGQQTYKRAAIAFDPLFCAATNNDGSVAYFPYDAADGMKRVTFNQPSTATHEDKLALAQEIFRNKDDLTLEVPTDEDDVAIAGVPQSVRGGFFTVDTAPEPYLDPGDAADDFRKRLFDAKYSWLFTLVPSDDAYRLSIVIYRTRATVKNDAATEPEGPVNERNVTATFAGNVGRSFVSLASPEAVNLDIRAGTWMLIGTVVKKAGAADKYVYFWYRVIGVDDILDASGDPVIRFPTTQTGPFTREVSIDGPDWHVNDEVSPHAPVWGQPTVCGIFHGVVGVHEKTVQPERDSAWSN